MTRIRYLAAVSIAALTITSATVPTNAQVVVFDPNNYAQNVLTAARALQQINNQITSLQNQAQMLINQARNLANLPYSSLQQLQAVDPAHPTAPEPGSTYRLRRAADRPCFLDYLRSGIGVYIQPDPDIECAVALADLCRGTSGCAEGTGRCRR